MGRLVQKVVDERVWGRRAVELGQAHRGQKAAQAEAVGDEQAHELGPVIQQGVHEGGFEMEGPPLDVPPKEFTLGNVHAVPSYSQTQLIQVG